ncbi:helix-turn-helix domain-containing protein [Gordonia sp. CPCC 206044]|uniref:TetR/AcrR family transcriptional regulator n=1 Tax=Gordonia sp. CPCC 206044 TaxID=3140793 RepID=UPI003AF3DE09
MASSRAVQSAESTRERPGQPRSGQRTRQILRAATELFQEVGYQNVSIDQIGAAVGLTGPALYRHFASKHDLLVAALLGQVEVVDAVADQAGKESPTATVELDRFLEGMADLGVDRDEAMLWRSEQRHLREAEQLAFRAEFGDVRRRVASLVSAARGGVTDETADLIAYLVLSMYAQSRDMRPGLAPARLRRTLLTLGHAIVDFSPADTGAPAPAPPPQARVPAGRRARIVHAASELFDARGYFDVRIDDIARASGLSVATLYQHFASKAEILQAVLEHGLHGLLFTTARALAEAQTPRSRLDALIGSYVDLVMGTTGRALRILGTDVIYLPDETRACIRELQGDHLAEWVDAICAIDPELGTADARAIAIATIGTITDMSQTPRVRARAHIHRELVAVATAMCTPRDHLPLD